MGISKVGSDRSLRNGWIRVKWENGNQHNYKWGADGKTEVKSFCSDKLLGVSNQASCQNGNGEDYSGSASKTISGLTCEKWSSVKDPQYQSLGDNNYCRNPDEDSGVW